MTNSEYETLLNKLPNQLRRCVKEIEINFDEARVMRDNGEISVQQFEIFESLMCFLDDLYFN